MCVCVLVARSCSTLCYPMDCSQPGFSVLWILQARILEWVAIPSSKEPPPFRSRTPLSRTLTWDTWVGLSPNKQGNQLCPANLPVRHRDVPGCQGLFYTEPELKKQRAHLGFSRCCRTCLPVQEMRGTWVPPLGREGPLEKGMATLQAVFSPGESHRQRSLVSYRPRGHTELDTTGHIHTHV